MVVKSITSARKMIRVTPLMAQQALDSARIYKTLVLGTTAARKADVVRELVVEQTDYDVEAPEPYFVTKLEPHPKPYHPDDKMVKHRMRRFQVIYENGTRTAKGVAIEARTREPSTVHAADLVSLCGTTFHIKELEQILGPAPWPLKDTPTGHYLAKHAL